MGRDWISRKTENPKYFSLQDEDDSESAREESPEPSWGKHFRAGKLSWLSILLAGTHVTIVLLLIAILTCLDRNAASVGTRRYPEVPNCEFSLYGAAMIRH